MNKHCDFDEHAIKSSIKGLLCSFHLLKSGYMVLLNHVKGDCWWLAFAAETDMGYLRSGIVMWSLGTVDYSVLK